MPDPGEAFENEETPRRRANVAACRQMKKKLPGIRQRESFFQFLELFAKMFQRANVIPSDCRRGMKAASPSINYGDKTLA
ncbi:hypothetical protein SH528x_003444 [Novipirellula sp. SH528]|uniref:hypothetical protein n=1 Tax=Novipirellula sp. SH528 TaxID=3454466 RepID=UPI003F9EE40F